MSYAYSTHTRHGAVSEQRFWLWATISAVLHIVMAIIIGRSTIAAHDQMKPIETYLVDYPSNLAAVPKQATIPTRSFSDSHPVQATATLQPEAAVPISAAAPMKTSQTDTIPVKETNVARNPVHQAPESGVTKGGNLIYATPISAQAGHNNGVATPSVAPGGNESLGEMIIGETGAPLFIHREPPTYPFLARKLGKEGRVVVRLMLDESGRQKGIEVVETSGFGFTDAAVTALKKSIFSPASKNGKAIPSRVLVPVRFVLND